MHSIIGNIRGFTVLRLFLHVLQSCAGTVSAACSETIADLHAAAVVQPVTAAAAFGLTDRCASARLLWWLERLLLVFM